MTSTFSQRQRAIEDVSQRCSRSRQLQRSSRQNLADAVSAVNDILWDADTKLALADLVAETGTGTDADKIQQIEAAKLLGEAEILRNYAGAAGALWDVLAGVDLSNGISDPSTKQAILAALTNALG